VPEALHLGQPRVCASMLNTVRNQMHPLTLRVSILVAFTLAAVRAADAQYQPIDLGTLGGTESSAAAVNNNGQVVGYSYTAGNVEVHAFSWTAVGGMVDLGTLGGLVSFAFAVSENGQVVGSSHTGNNEVHAFSWTAAGGMVDLGTFGGSNSVAVDVSDSGRVVGSSMSAGNAATHAFSWTASGGMVDLGTLGGPLSEARAVSESGQVVGYSYTAGNPEAQAFSWTAAGGMVDLGTLRGGASVSVDVSNRGQVVGYSAAAGAFSWTPSGGMVDLGTLGGASYAYAVNEGGQVVGYSYTAGNEYHAFAWTAARGMIDLGTFGGGSSVAVDVSDSGQAVGYIDTGYAFSWTADGGMAGLGALPDDINSAATAVNNNGQVVGYSWGLDTVPHATMWLLPITVTSALDKLIDQVTAYSLQKGLTNALTVKLKAALASWQTGRSNAAVHQIGAFVHQIIAKRDKALTEAQADTLIRMANEIVQAIKTGTAL
jgi:probable HAF family extracellular repeat protein